MHLDAHTFYTLPEADQAAVQEWLTAHGVEPKRTVSFQIEDGQVTAECHLLRDGRPYLNDQHEVATEQLTRTVVEPLLLSGDAADRLARAQ